MAGLLKVDVDSGVALVTLNRAEKRNALSIELREELTAGMSALAGNDDVGCAVLTGAGTAFCSGMDTTEFGGDRAHKETLVRVSVEAFQSVGRFPKPTLAAVNGPAVAGGFALALLCDLRLASDTASMGFPELPAGIPPSYAAARSALPAALARRLTLTGELLNAGEALRLGIVSEVLSAANLLPRALELAGRIAALPRSATLETKRRILLETEQTWGMLFEAEEQALRAALLGPGS
jgi:enoyl-CoA hydratase/carnithine racemase